MRGPSTAPSTNTRQQPDGRMGWPHTWFTVTQLHGGWRRTAQTPSNKPTNGRAAPSTPSGSPDGRTGGATSSGLRHLVAAGDRK
jgi:hypothetical protein